MTEPPYMTTFPIDPPQVTEDEAAVFMIHHLQLAAAYFEVSPPDIELRMARVFAENPPIHHLWWPAAQAWISVLQRTYEEEDDNAQ